MSQEVRDFGGVDGFDGSELLHLFERLIHSIEMVLFSPTALLSFHSALFFYFGLAWHSVGMAKPIEQGM